MTRAYLLLACGCTPEGIRTGPLSTVGGEPAGTDVLTDVDGDGVPYSVDCNDQDAAVQVGLPESCGNGIDDDCDGWTDGSDQDCPLEGDVDAENDDLAWAGAPEWVADVDGDDALDGITQTGGTHDDTHSVLTSDYTVTTFAGETHTYTTKACQEWECGGASEPLGTIPDFNGDGVPEVWGVDLDYDGTYGRAVIVRAGPPWDWDTSETLSSFGDKPLPGPYLAMVTDHDNDGIDDYVIAGRRNEGYAYVESSATDGEVQLSSVHLASLYQSNDSEFGADLVTADFDADGAGELVVLDDNWPGSTYEQWGRVLVYDLPLEGDQEATEAARAIREADDVARIEAIAAMGDADGDGYDDLAIGWSGFPLVTVHRGPLDGTLGRADTQAEAWATVAADDGEMESGLEALPDSSDLDGDGALDLVVTDANSVAWEDDDGGMVFAGLAEGTWTFADATLRVKGPGRGAIAAVSDLDGDGLGDVVWADEQSDSQSTDEAAVWSGDDWTGYRILIGR